MTTDELKKLLEASPFRPFTVVMASEKSFIIHHRDFAWLSPRGRTLFVGHSEDDAVGILDVPLIARIELHDPSRPSS